MVNERYYCPIAELLNIYNMRLIKNTLQHAGKTYTDLSTSEIRALLKQYKVKLAVCGFRSICEQPFKDKLTACNRNNLKHRLGELNEK